jgi:GxxExxY protein
MEERLTCEIIGAFYEVYNHLGYGFLEHVYVHALERELKARGLRVGREVGVQVYYKGEPITTQRLDILVEDRVVVELKAGPELPKLTNRQVYSYLRATRLEVGLLLHFGPDARFYRIVKPNLAAGVGHSVRD